MPFSVRISTVFRHCVRAFLLFSSTFCVHFYYFPALFSVRISTVFSTVGVHFYYVAVLSACISAVFVCVCMCVFVCVCMCCIVFVCMCLYEFVCVLLCLYVFVCVCMCFVCVCIFYVLMCLYVSVCVCVYVSEIHQLFFFYEHFYCVPALLPESTRSARLHDSAENLCWEGNLCLRFDINRALVILMEEHFTMSRVGMTL